MLHKILSEIHAELSGDAAFAHVAKIAGFHRIQASPGFRAAAEYVADVLQKRGLDAEVLSYPATEESLYWSQKGFMEWECEEASLTVEIDGKPLRLASFDDEKISLIQRSVPTAGRVQTSLVLVDDAHLEPSYEGLDVKGKMVLCRGDVTSISKMAVDKMGALGIVIDNMSVFPPVRDRMEVPDARQYTSFWPTNVSTFKALGFVLSPRLGALLRKRLAGSKELPCSVIVRSRFFDGTMENVTAVIPGEIAEEVVAIAHLCHPQPSANDNASGSGALIEAARAIHVLISEGRLPKPKRTIRFLWVPEMTGSYTYLSGNEDKLTSYVAAINLDMVGENQDLCKGPLLVERPPKALAGFGGDLAESILNTLTKEAPNLAHTSSYALFKWAVTPFSGGSDHYIWADPNVGVTCPMLIQWPDRYYHTSEDTIDKVDPKMLHIVGTLTAAYLYFTASAGPAEAAHLAREMASNFEGEVSAALHEVLERAHDSFEKALPGERESALSKARRSIELKCDFLASRKLLDLESVVRLSGDSAVVDAAITDAAALVTHVDSFHKTKALQELCALAGLTSISDLPPAYVPSGEAEDRAVAIVPVRGYKGPFSGRGHAVTHDDEEADQAFTKNHNEAFRYVTYVQYWADGKRNLQEIADMVEAECGIRDIEGIIDYIEHAKRYGVFTT